MLTYVWPPWQGHFYDTVNLCQCQSAAAFPSPGWGRLGGGEIGAAVRTEVEDGLLETLLKRRLCYTSARMLGTYRGRHDVAPF